MYLLVTEARSTRYSGSPSRVAIQPAARVLPVPDGPTSRARHPGPVARARCGAEPADQRVAQPAAREQAVERLAQRGHEDEGVVVDVVFEQLGEGAEVGADTAARGGGDMGAGQRLARARGGGAGRLPELDDAPGAVPVLAGEAVKHRGGKAVAERLLPQRPALSRRWHGEPPFGDRALRLETAIGAAHHQHGPAMAGEGGQALAVAGRQAQAQHRQAAAQPQPGTEAGRHLAADEGRSRAERGGDLGGGRARFAVERGTNHQHARAATGEAVGVAAGRRARRRRQRGQRAAVVVNAGEAALVAAQRHHDRQRQAHAALAQRAILRHELDQAVPLRRPVGEAGQRFGFAQALAQRGEQAEAGAGLAHRVLQPDQRAGRHRLELAGARQRDRHRLGQRQALVAGQGVQGAVGLGRSVQPRTERCAGAGLLILIRSLDSCALRLEAEPVAVRAQPVGLGTLAG